MDKKTQKIINEVIKPEAREEAISIMKLAQQKDFDELIEYYDKKSFNIVCMVIDKVKSGLVKEGKLTQNENDHFGEFW
ncbi:MAG: hypothetical protein HC831_29615 [Chloroflexia bacterium]|nr:hypothetical protein [Chloroflexia bacterium]